MFKNTASQKITFLVIDTATNLPKTGDAANLTAYVSIDDGAVTQLTDTSATELSSTNAPGLYTFDVAQAETNGDKLVFSGKSSTSGVRVVPLLIYTLPANFSGLSITGGVVQADAAKINGVSTASVTTVNANIGTTQPVNHTGTDASARVQSDLRMILGTAPTEGAAGRLAGAFSVQYDVATPVFTAASVNQTGDSYPRIGANGAGLTSLAPASTALSTAVWTATLAGYLANLNTGGVVASQADVNALNQSASRRVTLVTVPQYERPEASSATYTIEARTYDGDGAAVNADTTPTLTATGIVSGSLAANLSAATNPATGVYRWTYTVATGATQEQIRFDLSATISSSVFTMSTYSQVVDEVSQTWTATNATQLAAIYNKLPSKNYLGGTDNSTGALEASAFTGNFAGSVGSISGVTFPSNFSALGITDSGYVSHVVLVDTTTTNTDMLTQANVRSALGTAGNLDTQLSAIKTDTGNLVTRITSTLFSGITSLAQWLGLIAGKQAGNSTARTELRATGAGSGSYDETTDSQEAIRDRGDAAWVTGSGGGGGGTGSGAYTLTITVNDGSTALQNANVRVTQGATSLITQTNASGQVVFGVDAATWAVAITKDGYQFTPTTLTVSASASQTYSMTQVSVTPNPDSDKSTVVVTCYGADTEVEPGATLYVRQITAPSGDEDHAYSGAEIEYTADGSGVVTLTLWAGAKYEVQRGDKRWLQTITPAAGTDSLASFVGRST